MPGDIEMTPGAVEMTPGAVQITPGAVEKTPGSVEKTPIYGGIELVTPKTDGRLSKIQNLRIFALILGQTVFWI